MEKVTVTSVSEYIDKIGEIIRTYEGENIVNVFRGETKEYPTSGLPNIFRKDLLSQNLYFERDLFDEICANKISKANNYLEMAIDAQHGGFPSRLLDVTYNCLVALYFATTPFYRDSEDATDGKDHGIVYVYTIGCMFCPTSNHISANYNSQILRDKCWYTDTLIFQKNHKLIDQKEEFYKEIDFYEKEIVLSKGNKIHCIEIIKEFETVMYEYKLGFEQLQNNIGLRKDQFLFGFVDDEKKDIADAVLKLIEDYNNVIITTITELQSWLKNEYGDNLFSPNELRV